MKLFEIFIQHIKLILILTILVLTFVTCTPALQKNKPEKSTIGNVLFIPPKGWQRIEQSGGIAFIPAGKTLENASSFIAILPGQNLESNFREWFDRTLEQLHKGSKVISKGDVVETTDDDKVYPVFLVPVIIKTQDGRQSYRFYVAAHPGNRAEMFVLSASSQEEYNQYTPVLEEFLKQVDFVNIAKNNKSNSTTSVNNSPSEKPTSNSNALSGLYVGTESRQQFNPNTKFYDYIVRQVYYFFSPDGRIYYGLPRGGTLDNFDLDKAQKFDPNNCGFYKISEGKIQFRVGDNAPGPEKAFTNNQKFLQIGQTKFYKVETSSNLRLNGIYSIKTFTNTSSGSNVGGVGGETQITFSSDGKFTQKGFVGFSGSGSNVGVATSSKTNGSGTYRISGNTLELTYSDGQKSNYTFYIYPENLGEARPGLVIIDGGSYLLRN